MAVQYVSLCGLNHSQKATRPQKKNFVANNCLSEHNTKKVVNIVLFYLI